MKLNNIFGDISRLKHFIVMAMIAFVFVHFIGLGVVVLGLIVGVAKELYDRHYRHTFFDWYDVVWTFNGGLFAFIIYKLLT